MDSFNDYDYLAKAFNTPKDYQLPDDADFKSDRTKPQLNSYTFAHELYFGQQPTSNFLPTFCFIDTVDKSGKILLATNDFNTGLTRSSVVRTENYEEILKLEEAKVDFVYPCHHTITSLKFLYANLIFVGNRNGEAILLSTHAQKNNDSTFYTSRSQVKGCPSAVDYIKSDNELVIGTQYGHLSKFTISSSLQLLSERIYCHADAVTGVTTVSDKNYATCSRDRSCIVWDDRQFPSAKVLLVNHESQLTAVHWSEKSQNLIIGDELGNLLTVDMRSPHKILNKSKLSNREITSITSNNKHDLGIVSKSDVVKIAEISENNEIKLIFERKTDGIIYDMAWDAVDPETFYIVGEQRLVKKLSYH